jgi:DMSO/TMAO reductase YedYZ molybdopterin-dependent catalytic subunit
MDGPTPPVRALSRRAAVIGAAQAIAVLAAACTGLRSAPGSPAAVSRNSPAASPLAPSSAAASPTAGAVPGGPALGATVDRSCLAALPAVVPPTPIPYPGYTQVEPSTGLHVTAQPQAVNVETYRLVIKGKVANELSLTYDELRCLPKIGGQVMIQCPGFFSDTSNLAGASFASVLALAEPLEGARQLDLRGVDGRATQITLAEAQGDGYFLAYEWEGEALPVSHGFPVRAAMPNVIGGSWIKWLQEIEIS